MKILVTGGAGFIGSHVVDAYLDNGHEVVIVDNMSTGRTENVNEQAKFYNVDITTRKLEDVFDLERPDVVNHHAAQVDVRRSIVDPMFDAQVNVVGSLNVIECARKLGVKKFIHISSGGAIYGEPERLPCQESHPIKPLSPYGISKYVTEQYLAAYSRNYDMKYIVLRYANVYGPRQDPNGEAGVIAIFTGKMLTGDRPVIFGDGLQERDFVYVADCVRANLLATTSAADGAFNIGTGIGTTVNKLGQTLRELTGFQEELIHGPSIIGETRQIYLDCTRAQVELGWRAQVTLKEGLQATVESMA